MVRSTARTGPASRKGVRAAIPQLSWSEIRPAPVVLVSGAEGFLADRAIRCLRELLRNEDPALELTELEAEAYTAGELVTVASPSLFGEPRLIVVSGVEKTSDAFLTDAIDYLSSPAVGATVVLRHRGGVRGKRLLDAVRAATGSAIEVVCAELKKDIERSDFAVAEFRIAGRKTTPAAVRALVSAFPDDLAELSAACHQLMADAGEEITEATVVTYYGGRVHTNAFEVADTAIAGRHGEALIALRQALASGSDPVPIVAAFAMKIRTMAKVAASRGSAAQLAGVLDLAPWQIDRARRELAGWDGSRIASVLSALAEADADVKGGGRDPVFVLERLIGTVVDQRLDSSVAHYAGRGSG